VPAYWSGHRNQATIKKVDMDNFQAVRESQSEVPGDAITEMQLESS